MPWEYPNNVPASARYLKPSIQRKVVAISNAILRNGGDEGMAISTAIKKAKELHKKRLEKIANIEGGPHSNLKSVFENADLGARTDIPLAKGLPKRSNIIKLAAFGFKIKRINIDSLRNILRF